MASGATAFSTTTASYTTVNFDPSTPNVFVLTYSDNNNNSYLTAVVGTVSGTSISFGAKYVLYSVNSASTSVAFDPHNAGRFVVCSGIWNSGDRVGTAIVGQVSGTTIPAGSGYTFNADMGPSALIIGSMWVNN